MLADSGQAYVRVTGASMQPLLRHLRDGVIIVPATKVRKGDIALCARWNGCYVLHRVVRVRGDRFTMVGDHVWYADKDLSLDQLVGVVSVLCRNGKEIPCSRLSVRIYGWVQAQIALPRLWLRRFAKNVTRPLRKAWREHRKGAKR